MAIYEKEISDLQKNSVELIKKRINEVRDLCALRVCHWMLVRLNVAHRQREV